MQSVTNTEDSMLSDLLTKHESFSDRMKDIWQSLLGDWEKMLLQMVEKSSLLNGINAEFFKIFGGGDSGGVGTAGGIASGSGMGASSGGGSGGIGGVLQQLIGSGGSQQQGVPAQLTDDSIQKITGSTDGVDSSLGDTVGGAFKSTGAIAGNLFGDAATGAGEGSEQSSAFELASSG